jgi:hypothetical protein
VFVDLLDPTKAYQEEFLMPYLAHPCFRKTEQAYASTLLILGGEIESFVRKTMPIQTVSVRVQRRRTPQRGKSLELLD